jgi:hypothetical protein
MMPEGDLDGENVLDRAGEAHAEVQVAHGAPV